LFSQTTGKYRWWNPVDNPFPVIAGRNWQEQLANPYDRLPAVAEKTVRPEVWRLGHNSAGEYISFTTDAASIEVRYQVKGSLNMPHMPSTGVSGVDLYAKDSRDTWHWIRASYHFGDTVTYKFNNIASAFPIKEYRLYLPLYNTPTWMQIGVPEKNTFTPIAADTKKTIVLYGTSIMQGGCASRPGLAWSNILGRRINTPIINLGFSGNGRLEEPLIALMNETDAGLFVLDCMPNLTDKKVFPEAEIKKRILTSVSNLRLQHPEIPILLVEHCAAVQGTNLDTTQLNLYKWVSDILAETYREMKAKQIRNIFLLTTAEIGFDTESTVDGTHPNDIGMMKYANAYEKVIRQIFKAQK
jgi:lysophospholipase L1-like esterase